MKNFLFLIIPALLCAGSGCASSTNYAPITTTEYSTSTVASTGAICIKASSSLVARCAEAGGTIQNNLTLAGFALLNTLGCYPTGGTTDPGKKCSADTDCQGQCLWFAGDVVTTGSSKTCSDHKKPFFTAAEQNPYTLCDN
jgi:hypothetical protein